MLMLTKAEWSLRCHVQRENAWTAVCLHSLSPKFFVKSLQAAYRKVSSSDGTDLGYAYEEALAQKSSEMVWSTAYL